MTLTASATPVALLRSNAQRLSSHTLSRPEELVSWLCAVQAQDYAGSKWAIGVRMPEGTASEAKIDEAIAAGTILRTHAMRWTWQLVSPADIRWIVALVSQRLLASSERRHAELELGVATFNKSLAVIERALRNGEHLTRDELSKVLERSKILATGPRLSHLLANAELNGLICSGKPKGRKTTHALLALRAPDARPVLPREEALAELALRYFRSRGPATVNDFAWWSGLTMAEARAGLSDVRASLVSEVTDGETTWRAEVADPRPLPAALLLPAFDEYLVAYRDRCAVLDTRHAGRVNAGGGMLDPCVVIDGRVIGTWRRSIGSKSVRVAIAPFGRLTKKDEQRVAAAANRYGAFVDREVELERGASLTSPARRS